MSTNERDNGAVDVLSMARRLVESGLSILPVKLNGTKKPIGAWDWLQERRPTANELPRLFGRPAGIATVCGKVSGNLEVLDVDGGSLIQPFEAAVEAECPGLIERLCTDQTPRDGGGCQYKYRCLELVIPGNQKFALSEPEPVFEDVAPVIDQRTGQQRIAPRTLIETRGEGGYAIAPGSPLSVHKTGRPYRHIRGPELTDLPTITAAEREILLRVARSFNRYVDDHSPREGERPTRTHSGLAPGDDFNRRASWGEILEPHGWKQSGTHGGIVHWTRPGKSVTDGNSATTGLTSKAGNDLLCVFSTNAHPFVVPSGKICETLSKFAAFALLNHGGDFSAAAKALAEQGYGDNPARQYARGEPGGAGLTNAIRTKDEDGGTNIQPLPIQQIIETLHKQTGTWPRCVGELAFVHDPDHGIDYLTKQEALFGWIHREVGAVDWSQATGCVTKGEFFAELRRTAPRYRGIETLPHFPPIDDHYYAHARIKPGNGATLRVLLKRFNPATTIDADLILALFVTPFWGGPGGMRPAFVVTADEGRGSGKTALLRAVGHLVGGAFEIGVADPIEAVKKRLLTPSALTKRLVLGDNIKSTKYSNGDLEALITAAEVSGHQMYVGEATRPNTLLWTFTLNGPSFSRDLAQRCVIIKVAKPLYCATWWEDTAAFIDTNRAKLLADIAAFYATPAVKLEKCSRWGAWEKDVLARLPEPSDAQKVIAERQEAIDGDSEEVGVVEDYFEQQLRRYGYADEDSVHIPTKVAAEWFSEAMNERWTTTAVTRAVNQYATEGDLRFLMVNPSRANGRGLLWYAGGETRHDLVDRIEAEKERRRRGF